MSAIPPTSIDLVGTESLGSLSIEQLKHLSLGLTMNFDCEVFIRGGAFWLGFLGVGAMRMRWECAVNDVWEHAQTIFEAAERQTH